MKAYLEKRLSLLERDMVTFKALVLREQQTCEHTNLEECAYKPDRYGGASPPMRVCCDCGMTERGWGPGYVVLRGGARMTDRDQLYAKHYGFSLQDHHKGPLLRGETTLAQLVALET
jgi:hypothetical protein